MTLINMINADFSGIIRVYHNHLRHLRSIVFVVYYFRVTQIVYSRLSRVAAFVSLSLWERVGVRALKKSNS
jgi:hypothetical protein